MIIQIKEWNLYKSENTPLHFTGQNNSVEIVELLISKGANIQAKNIIH